MKRILAAMVAVAATAATAATQDDALAALKKAATYYRTTLASHGGYVYYYSVEDLTKRWGEGAATMDQIFVQPPGTPAVGLAYLKAYQATGDAWYLDAAKETAHALIYGQLESGGWRQTIDFDPKGTMVGQYRNGRGKGRNHTSLDDNQTQAAILFMARTDYALDFKDAAIHESALFALDALLKAQFPNGGFPQGFTGPVAAQPVVKANYPDPWPRTWPNEHYWDYYTLNDNVAGTVSEALLVSFYLYKDSRYRDALKRLGDFLILAQMPEPQPAWAQQYNFAMQPAWARKFEPPAICGLESEDAIRTLLKISRLTGEIKYLQPIPRALEYLKKCRLPDGRMARYYELQTNRPLYMNRKDGNYFLTFDDTDLPSHYGWKQPTEIDALEREYNDWKAGKPRMLPKTKPAELEAKARKAIADLDAEGRWISTYTNERLVGQPKFKPGFRYIGSNVFIQNVELLSEYVAANSAK
jgi:hypothetical protein